MFSFWNDPPVTDYLGCVIAIGTRLFVIEIPIHERRWNRATVVLNFDWVVGVFKLSTPIGIRVG